MPENFSAADISFKQMSEDKAVNAFQDDGYFDYQKRTMRYRSMSRDSSWATAPATMFVGVKGISVALPKSSPIPPAVRVALFNFQ